MTDVGSAETVVVLNPASGRGNHADAVRERAEAAGYTLTRTEAAGDAVLLARDAAAAGVSTIVAAGGDGTVNEVIRGIDRAGGFDTATLGIIPVGTGNNFAANIGIPDVEAGFAAIEGGERRRIDLGRADGHLFANSCVAGLTAESSSETSRELKDRLGVLAYVITTLRSMSDFEAVRLTVDIDDEAGGTTAWSGDALFVLVGNGRRFSGSGTSQANMEDGLLDVTVIEDVSAVDLMSDTLLDRLLGRDSPHLVRTRAAAMTITIHRVGSTSFSLDGEIVEADGLSLDVRPRALSVTVGESYEPTPDDR